MSAAQPEFLSPLNESQIATRKERLGRLAFMIFRLMSEDFLYQGGKNHEFDESESASLLAALRVCSFYTKNISTDTSDDLVKVVFIEGADNHHYLIQIPLVGPGITVYAGRARVTELSLLAGEEARTDGSLKAFYTHSERVTLNDVSIDRAFLIGMSMVIEMMDEIDEGEDEDERLKPLIQFITPTREELREVRVRNPAPVVSLDDDDPY